jgi:starch phosphorylase
MTTAFEEPIVAYFSMEVGLDPNMPTYSGGLGVLAGDTLRAAADLGIPLVGVTLLHRKGYFRQSLDSRGNQTESPSTWAPEAFLEPLPARTTVTLEGRKVQLRAWRYAVRGVGGHEVPVLFLDAALEENSPQDQALTDYLYGGDLRYRFCQEVILGLGGVAMLRALGYRKVRTYHMNEGHSALLVLGLLGQIEEEQGGLTVTPAVREQVRHQCVFTTHTPVPAGNDKFPIEVVRSVLGEKLTTLLAETKCYLNPSLNMTYLALFFSRYVNGVALHHGAISRDMYPGYPINSITNGVHAVTWTSTPFQRLYDRHIPEWRSDNLYLRYAISIPVEEVRETHAAAKRILLAEVERRSGAQLDPSAFTLGFARRAATYKRADLLFSDPDRLRAIVREAGPLQVLYAGKAHPRDEGGKAMIARVFEAAARLQGAVRVVYLPEYDMALAKHLCAGVDTWLNTPQKPQEASGTSGMKAAMNGVPSLSVVDGWWVEGHVEGVTGWSIGSDEFTPDNREQEVASLYDKLGKTILPLYYRDPAAFAAIRRSTIALNGSFFNAQRMMGQYLQNAYLLRAGATSDQDVPAEPSLRKDT